MGILRLSHVDIKVPDLDLAAAYYTLARAWPSMFAYQHILEAEIITLDEDGTSS